MKICMVGLGYIGLPTACLLAKNNDDIVYGFDTNVQLIEKIRNNTYETSEFLLNEILHEVVSREKLIVSNEIPKAEVYIIAVPTPFNDDKTCDTKYIEIATRDIAKVIEKDGLVILESTVSPGTTEKIVESILSEETDYEIGVDLHIAYSAERVIPGKIIYELEHNDRIVGGTTPLSSNKAKEVYEIFVNGDIHLTDCVTAEVTKLMENTYRDINIAIANEFAVLAEKMDFNVWEAITLANKHPRVDILNPGPGVGGHCIAVDPWFFVGIDEENTKLI
ncbi:MAG: nucleotide sugar dehydrogenase, partial [Acidaminobacteraceae bacterium]